MITSDHGGGWGTGMERKSIADYLPKVSRGTRMNSDPKREVLRHLLSTVRFRGSVAIGDAPEGFADFRAAGSTRSAGELLAHIGDLIAGSHFLLKGEYVELATEPLPWEAEKTRFRDSLKELDGFLASDAPLAYPVEKFVQGPIGDALTHVGQIVLLRRMAGFPIEPVSYFTAEIVPGED
jgi:hypothetical protein